jgi:FAD/FMN-containing dehydrogenase
MSELRATTIDGDETVLAETAVEGLKTRLRGRLIRRRDEEYDEARAVFNAMINRYPALIIRCAGVADVIDAVNFARDNNLLVAVRGGGHNVTGSAVCDGGIVIDLSQMKGMRIDPTARTVRTEPGLTWGELNHDLHVFGLGASGGFVSITGIPGLTLGGGFGWLVRKHGLAMDNLLSVDIVTADGRFLTASATQNSDLFWGVRGGGGNFGVVTSLEFQVHPVGTVLGGLVIHPVTSAKDVLRLLRESVDTVPDELTWGILALYGAATTLSPGKNAWRPCNSHWPLLRWTNRRGGTGSKAPARLRPPFGGCDPRDALQRSSDDG